MKAKEIIIHEKFNDKNYTGEYNIVLVRLETKVSFNNYIEPACLWNLRNDPINKLEHLL